MRMIVRLAALAVFFVPSVIAWIVCPILFGHGSSSAFDMGVGIVILSIFSAAYGLLNFKNTAA